MKTRDLTFLSLLVAVLVAGGYALYFLSKALPIPGGKFLVMSPYLSLMMLLALDRLRSRWTLTLVSLVFAIIVAALAPLMGLAIVTAGILSDLCGRLARGNEQSEAALCHRAACYPLWSFWLSLTVSHYVTGRLLFGALGIWPLLWGGGLVYASGLAGASMGLRVSRRIFRKGARQDSAL